MFVTSRLKWDEIRRQTHESEKLGFHSMWFADHIVLRGPRLECWTLLSALAPLTDRIRLGSLVLCNSFRNPALVAKMGATLDVVSNGRLELGIGAGWHRTEYEAYGYEFPPAKSRIDHLEEGVQIIRRMWTEEHPTFHGKYFAIKDANCEPKPLQEPHPPITIGGGGEKFTLRVVAQFADRCNFMGALETCRHKLKVLNKHCLETGRDYDKIEKSLFSYIHIGKDQDVLRREMKRIYEMSNLSQPFDDWYEENRQRMILGTAEECLDQIKGFQEAGFTLFIFRFYQRPSVDRIRELYDQVISCI